MTDARRGWAYFAVVLAVILAPTAISLGWYQLSKNPNLRPLGITRESLMSYASGFIGGHEIVATVAWVPPKSSRYSKARLKDAITNAFGAKGVDVRVVFREGKGRTLVTYTVGKSTIGPYPTSRAAEGISAAIEAMRMHGDPE